MKTIALLAVLLVAATAGAEPDPHVRALAASAQAHFDLGEYPDAIADWRAAYRAEPHPGLLYDLAQAYRLDGDCVTASLFYRNFLRAAPRSPHRAIAEQNLAAIADCTRDRRRAGDVPVAEDGAATPRLPPPPPAAIDPTPPRAAHRGRTLRILGTALAGAGGALALTGGWFALDAAQASDQVSQVYAAGGAWADIAAVDARGRRSAVASTMLFAGGGAALAAGGVMWWLGWRAERVMVVPEQRGVQVVMRW